MLAAGDAAVRGAGADERAGWFDRAGPAENGRWRLHSGSVGSGESASPNVGC